MTIMEQMEIATQLLAFLAQWGLKSQYVAERCGISPNTLSAFARGHTSVSEETLGQIKQYMEDYERRMT